MVHFPDSQITVFFVSCSPCLVLFQISIFANSNKHIPYVTYGNVGEKLPFLDPNPLRDGGVGEEEKEVLIPKMISFDKGKRIECEKALLDPPKHSSLSFYKIPPPHTNLTNEGS